MRTSSPGRLRSILMDSSEPVLLLGAGASITSGIPGRGQNRREGGALGLVQGERPSGRLHQADHDDRMVAKHRSKAFDQARFERLNLAGSNLLGVKRDRREFFEKLINPSEVPGAGQVRQLPPWRLLVCPRKRAGQASFALG